MHWQKEHNFEALSPENQVQPTNKGREEEEIHVGTNHASTVIWQTRADKAKSLSINTSQAACAEHLEHIQSKGPQRFLMEACDIKDNWKLI